MLSLDFSPDGKLLATAGGQPAQSGQLKLWNVETGSLDREIDTGHKDTISSVRFSPDGQFLATAAADRLVRIFQASDGKLLRTIETHSNHVLGVAWRPDGKQLATAGADQVVKLWDAQSGAPLRTMRGDTYLLGDYKRAVTSVSFIGDTEHLLTSSGDRSVRMHRTSSSRDVRAFQTGLSFMHAAAATRDGRWILGGGQDGILYLWNGDIPTQAPVTFMPETRAH